MWANITTILSILLGIASFGYAIYTTKQLTKGVKMTALIKIRSLIDRMEEEKHKHQKDSIQWSAMHHTQQDLEALFEGLQTTFNIKK